MDGCLWQCSGAFKQLLRVAAISSQASAGSTAETEVSMPIIQQTGGQDFSQFPLHMGLNSKGTFVLGWMPNRFGWGQQKTSYSAILLMSLLRLLYCPMSSPHDCFIVSCFFACLILLLSNQGNVAPLEIRSLPFPKIYCYGLYLFRLSWTGFVWSLKFILLARLVICLKLLELKIKISQSSPVGFMCRLASSVSVLIIVAIPPWSLQLWLSLHAWLA